MLPRADERCRRTQEALGHLERALLSVTERREVYGAGFEEAAGQWVEEVLRLRAEVDELIGLAAYLREFGRPSGVPQPAAPGPVPGPAPVAHV